MTSSSRLALHASCEKLLAVSAYSVLPTLIPIRGRAFEWGFEYDFLAKLPCEEGILPLITEEMRRLIAQDIPFETLSMVPSNAQAFLQKNQPIQAEECSAYPSNVVPLCKVKDFYDICPEELLASSRAVSHFALFEMLFLPDRCIRIRGAAFDDKKLLKNYLKQVKRAKNNDPTRLARELDLLSLQDDEVVWHSQGLILKKALDKKVDTELNKLGFQEIFCDNAKTGAKALTTILQSKKYPLPYRFFQSIMRENDDREGIFSVCKASGKVYYIACKQINLLEEIISSLQFMKQMASILGMECHFVLLQRGKAKDLLLTDALTRLGYPYEMWRSDATQVELHALDLRGRSWPLAKLSFEQGEVPLIECVPILSYERIVALILEEGEAKVLEKMRTEEKTNT